MCCGFVGWGHVEAGDETWRKGEDCHGGFLTRNECMNVWINGWDSGIELWPEKGKDSGECVLKVSRNMNGNTKNY